MGCAWPGKVDMCVSGRLLPKCGLARSMYVCVAVYNRHDDGGLDGCVSGCTLSL